METKDFSSIRNNGPLPDPTGVIMPADIADLLDDYIESTVSQLEELEMAALACEAGEDLEQNTATIRQVLHKIKGESGMVGLDDYVCFCHEVESAFEDMTVPSRTDLVLRFKDWLTLSIKNLKS